MFNTAILLFYSKTRDIQIIITVYYIFDINISYFNYTLKLLLALI